MLEKSQTQYPTVDLTSLWIKNQAKTQYIVNFLKIVQYPVFMLYLYCKNSVDKLWIKYKNVEMELFASIDQGTSSTRTIIFDKDLKTVDSRQEAYELNFPNPGWVEIDPEVLRNSVMNTMKPLVDKYKDKLNSISITNQRESTIIWNKKTGKAIYPIIVWQDRRTEGYCNELKEQGHESMIQNKTGLVIDPYFSATKIKWILDNVPSAQDQAKKGEILFGTIDCYLVWLLTGKHLTDSTNASRTMIFNIQNQCWDDELLKLFGIPRNILPEVTASNFEFGECKNSGLKLNAVIGDQQAALVGQQCFNKNAMKVTFGTGCFLMMNMGKEFKISNKNFLPLLLTNLMINVFMAWRVAFFLLAPLSNGSEITLIFLIQQKKVSPISIRNGILMELSLFQHLQGLEYLSGILI